MKNKNNPEETPERTARHAKAAEVLGRLLSAVLREGMPELYVVEAADTQGEVCLVLGVGEGPHIVPMARILPTAELQALKPSGFVASVKDIEFQEDGLMFSGRFDPAPVAEGGG